MAMIACKRCEAKKLKASLREDTMCDERPRICLNCEKTNSSCISVDSRSRREFARGYIGDLQAKIEQLNAVLQARADDAGTHTSKAGNISIQSASPFAQSTYHGEGSSISMARIIEASLVPKVFNPSLSDVSLRAGMSQEHFSREDISAARLPPKETAQQLVDSYLNGTHQLHPFLQRSSLLSELELVYSGVGGHPTGSVMFRLFMVLAIGAVPLYRAGLHGVAAVGYYVTAMEYANVALGLGGRMEHIQAHLLVLMFSLQHDIGIGSKWDLSRVAMRICIENRYHRRPNRRLAPMEELMQKRLPVDADDDLVESDNIELQMVRGMSEVSAKLRQIALRQTTSSITTNLYRKPSTHDLNALQCAVEGIITRLDRWRSIFPILGQDRSAYETIQWRDLNYFRERLKCFRPLALLSKGNASHPWMDACQEAATHVVKLYRSLWTNDKLVLNWTCVHDMMSAGFTLLYCGLAQTDAQRKVEVSDMTACVSETLSHIAEKWASVNRHVSVFRAFSGQVADSMQLDAGNTNLEAMELTIEGAHPPENPEPLD